MARTLTLPSAHELSVAPLTVAGHTLNIWRVTDVERFLGRVVSERGDVSDDDIPYYAWIWPAAETLAAEILAGASLGGLRGLELGCGTGRSARHDPVDVIVASDVLYERRFCPAVAAAIAHLLRDDGVAMLADPSPPHLAAFVAEANHHGLTVTPGPILTAREQARVALYAVRRPGGRRASWEPDGS